MKKNLLLAIITLIFTFAITANIKADSDSTNSGIDTIDIVAEPTNDGQLGVNLRYRVERGTIIEFILDDKFKESYLPACTDMRTFTSSDICVDLFHNASNQAFVQGEKLGILKVRWDDITQKSLTKISGNGYSSINEFVEITDYVHPSQTLLATDNAANFSLQGSPLAIFLLVCSVVFFVVAIYLVGNKKILASLSTKKRIATEASSFVFAVLMMSTATVLFFAKPINEVNLNLLPLTGSEYGSYTTNKKVYVITFNPILANGQDLYTKMNWNKTETLVPEYINFMKQASHNKLNYSVVANTTIRDYTTLEGNKKYNEASFFKCINSPSKANCFVDNGGNWAMLDYNKLINEQKICEKFNAGEFDELWLFGGPYFGYYESRMIGKNSCWINAPEIRDTICEKELVVMGFNNERDVALMVEDFLHRFENTMRKAYGSFSPETLNTSYDKFFMNYKQHNKSFSGCGWAHYTPVSTHDYAWSESGTMSSYCDEFYKYPNIDTNVRKTVSCQNWGCTQSGYFAWLMDRFPSKDGVGPDGKAMDWWKYASDPGFANGRLQVLPTTTVPVTTLNATAKPQPVAGCLNDSKTYCSNHGGIALTVDHNVSNWNECLSWCNQNMNTVRSICQYNADGPRNCWINFAPKDGINSCTWVKGGPPYSACFKDLIPTPSVTPSITVSSTVTKTITPTLSATPTLKATTPTVTITKINTVTPTTTVTPTVVRYTITSPAVIQLAGLLDSWFTGTATPSTALLECGPMDFNKNGFIDLGDIWNIQSRYKQKCKGSSTNYGTCGSVDANLDGIINLTDLYYFSADYSNKSCFFK